MLQRSALRTANAPELSTIGSDERYRGKKVSRKSADKERLEGRNKNIAADEGEQATAELGYLFEGESDEEKDEDEVSDEDEDENVKEKGFQMSNENETDYGAFGGGFCVGRREETETLCVFMCRESCAERAIARCRSVCV